MAFLIPVPYSPWKLRYFLRDPGMCMSCFLLSRRHVCGLLSAFFSEVAFWCSGYWLRFFFFLIVQSSLKTSNKLLKETDTLEGISFNSITFCSIMLFVWTCIIYICNGKYRLIIGLKSIELFIMIGCSNHDIAVPSQILIKLPIILYLYHSIYSIL